MLRLKGSFLALVYFGSGNQDNVRQIQTNDMEQYVIVRVHLVG